jgi:hypothetical protein
MNTDHQNEVRELAANEIDEVSGGFFHGHGIVLLAFYAAMIGAGTAGRYSQGVKDLS